MKKIFAGAIFIAACSFTFPAKEISLKYVFKKGDSYEWTQKANATQHIVVAGMDQNVVTSIDAICDMKVVDIIGTSAKFEISYRSLSSKSKLPQGDMVMDSEGDTAVIYTKLMRAMKEKKFNFTLTKNGSVESVDGIDNLWSGFGKLGLSEAQLGQMKQVLDQSFGKDSFKRSIEGAFVYYPEQKVQTGSTWKNVHAANSKLPIQTENVWTLESITEPNAIVISDGVITTTDTTKVITPQPGLRATASLKGRQVTKSTVSVSHGWPLTCKSYSEIKGTMTLLAGGQIPEDMKMEMEITSESEYTIRKK
jgi:hypothetical protein